MNKTGKQHPCKATIIRKHKMRIKAFQLKKIPSQATANRIKQNNNRKNVYQHPRRIKELKQA